MAWRLYSRDEEEFKGETYFYEKWVEDETKSGMIFFSGLDEEGSKVYIVESYGIGTIDPKTFEEISDFAPIVYRKCHDEAEGRQFLENLQRELCPVEWRGDAEPD